MRRPHMEVLRLERGASKLVYAPIFRDMKVYGEARKINGGKDLTWYCVYRTAREFILAHMTQKRVCNDGRLP